MQGFEAILLSYDLPPFYAVNTPLYPPRLHLLSDNLSKNLLTRVSL